LGENQTRKQTFIVGLAERAYLKNPQPEPKKTEPGKWALPGIATDKIALGWGSVAHCFQRATKLPSHADTDTAVDTTQILQIHGYANDRTIIVVASIYTSIISLGITTRLCTQLADKKLTAAEAFIQFSTEIRARLKVKNQPG